MMRPPNAMRRRFKTQKQACDESGFTLVEMLVVITIIGMIMALVGPRVLNYLSDSRVKSARIQIQSFASAIDLFFLDAKRIPTSSEGLEALVRPVASVKSWNGPYIKGGAVPKDPWGNPYVYKQPGPAGTAYEIRSLGADGQEGGTGPAADITSAAPD